MLTPRWYQQGAIDSVFEYFAEHKDTKKNPLLQVPTAGGKSLIQAELIRTIIDQWPSQKILCLAHIKELLKQNYDELKGQAPHVSSGIFSAGLGRKELFNSVTFAGIQSVWDKAIHVGHIDLIFIDEAHLCPNKSIGRYRHFIDELKKINPYIRIVGLSATPWRLNGGSLTMGADRLFTDISYEIKIETLIEEGFLCPVSTGEHDKVANFNNLKVSASSGDFTSASITEAMESMDVVKPAVDDALKRAQGKNSLMWFCVSVKHAEMVQDCLNDLGESNRALTGKTAKKERERLIDGFKEFKYRHIISVDTITTGFNAKNADCLVCLRPTQSSALWVQIVGRVMRTHPSKQDALLLDYGGNVERHGPINKIQPPEPPKAKKVEGGSGLRKCPECKEVLSIEFLEQLQLDRVAYCPSCDFPIEMVERKPNHEVVAAKGSIVDSSGPSTVQRIPVDNIYFRRHKKMGSPDSVRVEYQCGLAVFKDWLCLDHQGSAHVKAWSWFKKMYGNTVNIPNTTDDAMQIKPTKPKEVVVDVSGQYPKVLSVEW